MPAAGYDISLSSSSAFGQRIGDFNPTYGFKYNWQTFAMIAVVVLLGLVIWFKRK